MNCNLLLSFFKVIHVWLMQLYIFIDLCLLSVCDCVAYMFCLMQLYIIYNLIDIFRLDNAYTKVTPKSIVMILFLG